MVIKLTYKLALWQNPIILIIFIAQEEMDVKLINNGQNRVNIKVNLLLASLKMESTVVRH